MPGPLGMGSCYQTQPDILSKTGFDNEHHWPLPRTTLLKETIQMRMDEVSKRHNHDTGKR
jgi:hypothetical protein